MSAEMGATDRSIRVAVATVTDLPVLANLFQFYRYDISATRGDVGEDVLPEGRYPVPAYLPSFWTDARCAPFLVFVGDHLVGFVLVRAYSQLTDDPTVRDILDCFIVRKYRGQGVGSAVARAIFDRFPGRWEVRAHTRNGAAQRFWRRVIAAYTEGRYTEVAWDDARHRGIVFGFAGRRGPTGQRDHRPCVVARSSRRVRWARRATGPGNDAVRAVNTNSL